MTKVSRLLTRGLLVASLAGMTALAVGGVGPVNAAGHGGLSASAAPNITCPTAKSSNGYIYTSKKTGKAAYYPTSLSGAVGTTSVSSVCVKNVTKTTQVMTAPSCVNFSVPANSTIAISAPSAGTYKCGLKGSTSVLTITIK